MRDRPYTVTEVAKCCHASREAVIDWIGAGKLAAYRTPIGRGHYRILPEELARFLKSNGMPLPDDLLHKERRKVLVMDDEEHVVEIMRRSIEAVMPEVEVHSATNGYEGCILAGALKPDLVILDIMMPGMDGFEVCRRLKGTDETRNAQVLVVSGFMEDDNIRRMRELGATDFLEKPVNIATIQAKVAELLGTGRSAREA